MGRAPSSGYCAECRKRRVKCDRTEPECRRCIKAGRTCSGYELPLRMVNHVVVGNSVAVVRQTRSSHTSLVATISRTQQELAFAYFFQNYAWAHFWRPIMPLFESPDNEASYKAGLAIAVGVKALRDKDKDLRVQAFDLYGTSINLFRKKFNDAMSRKTDMATLTSTVVLLSLFNLATEGNLNLVDHNGLIAILKHCGPEPFQHQPLLSMFRSCRASIICRSLDQAESTFLERPEWKTIPWSIHPKTADDLLQDLVVDLPTISEALRLHPAGLSHEMTLEFLGRLDSVSKQLDSWRWDWEESNLGAATTSGAQGLDTSTLAEPVLAAVLSSRIDMETITQALDINLYNTARLYVARQRQILLGNPQSSRDERQLSPEDLRSIETTAVRHRISPLLLPGEARLPCQYAMETARLMPYILDNLSSRRSDVALMVSPAWIALSAMKFQPELEEWAGTLPARFGFLGGPSNALFDIFQRGPANAICER